MLKIKAGKIQEIMKEIKKIQEVKEAYAITGAKDIIIRLESNEDLEKIAKIGNQDTRNSWGRKFGDLFCN